MSERARERVLLVNQHIEQMLHTNTYNHTDRRITTIHVKALAYFSFIFIVSSLCVRVLRSLFRVLAAIETAISLCKKHTESIHFHLCFFFAHSIASSSKCLKMRTVTPTDVRSLPDSICGRANRTRVSQYYLIRSRASCHSWRLSRVSSCVRARVCVHFIIITVFSFTIASSFLIFHTCTMPIAMFVAVATI